MGALDTRARPAGPGRSPRPRDSGLELQARTYLGQAYTPGRLSSGGRAATATIAFVQAGERSRASRGAAPPCGLRRRLAWRHAELGEFAEAIASARKRPDRRDDRSPVQPYRACSALRHRSIVIKGDTRGLSRRSSGRSSLVQTGNRSRSYRGSPPPPGLHARIGCGRRGAEASADGEQLRERTRSGGLSDSGSPSTLGAYLLAGRLERRTLLAERALALARAHGARHEAMPYAFSARSPPSGPLRAGTAETPLPPGTSPCHRTRHAPPRRPLPPRPRQALPAHGPARAGPGAPHHRDDDVPRDGHAVLAGAGRGGDEGAS